MRFVRSTRWLHWVSMLCFDDTNVNTHSRYKDASRSVFLRGLMDYFFISYFVNFIIFKSKSSCFKIKWIGLTFRFLCILIPLVEYILPYYMHICRSNKGTYLNSINRMQTENQFNSIAMQNIQLNKRIK